MVHFVGAGSGAPDLITLRGARLLGEADVVIYAGSLVNPELLTLTKPGCEVHDSAKLTLEEVIALIERAEREGKTTVRLHTGDPSIYGAVREQFDALTERGIDFDVCPGVSSFCGAAAALRAEYTLPNVSQTVIITRTAGRTPVPERESIRSLAAHQATMVLFLSTSLTEKLQGELLAGGYGETTPAAVVYKATWPEEKIFRCTVGTLHKTVTENGMKKTALIVVGGCLGGEGIPQGEGMKIAIFAYSHGGCAAARRVRAVLAEAETVCYAVPRLEEAGFLPLAKDIYRERFSSMDALIFIGACGIAVREIAPYLVSKKTDPAVLCIDEKMQFVIPLLSGHIGGANDLARRLAAALGAAAVITTATDVNGKFAVDAWAAKNECAISSMLLAKKVAAEILEHDVPLVSDFPIKGALSGGIVEKTQGALGIVIGYCTKEPFAETLRLTPRVLRVGIGCRRGTAQETIEAAVAAVLSAHQLDPSAVKGVYSIDLKQQEAGLLAACAKHNWPTVFYTAEELRSVPGEFTDSPFVQEMTGVGNVCERAAMRGAEKLLVKKTAVDGVTVAVAAEHWEVSFG